MQKHSYAVTVVAATVQEIDQAVNGAVNEIPFMELTRFDLYCLGENLQAGDFRESYPFQETGRKVIQKYVAHFTLEIYSVLL